MSSSLHRASEDHDAIHTDNGHATHHHDAPHPNENGTDSGKGLGPGTPKIEQTGPVNNPGKTPSPVTQANDAPNQTLARVAKRDDAPSMTSAAAGDTASKTPAPVTKATGVAGRTAATVVKMTDTTGNTQKTKETSAQRFVSLSKQGLAKAVGAAGGKTGAAKAAPDEPKETAELRVVYLPNPKLFPTPRVDIIAVHDIDETLQRAWIYRKKAKRRTHDSRPPLASGGINSHDGDGGFGTAGSPAPGRHGSRRQPQGTRKRTFDDSNNSIEKWLVSAGRPASAGAAVPQDQGISEEQLDDHGPSNPIFAPVEEHTHNLSLLGMLTPVPEDEISEQRPRVRRRPTLPNDRRRLPGHVANIIEDEKASSLGDRGGSRRHTADALSDRRSSQDQGTERRINWLSDPAMLPNEIQSARVMCYTYKSMKKVPSPWDYLNELAEDLEQRLKQMRPDQVKYEQVPIVFIGLGFGCLVIQRLLVLLNPTFNFGPTPPGADLTFTRVAGAIFLDGPAPLAAFPRSRSQETNQTWTRDWLTTKDDRAKIDLSSLWRHVWMATMGNVPVSWHYSPTAETTPDKVFAPYTHMPSNKLLVLTP